MGGCLRPAIFRAAINPVRERVELVNQASREMRKWTITYAQETRKAASPAP